MKIHLLRWPILRRGRPPQWSSSANFVPRWQQLASRTHDDSPGTAGQPHCNSPRIKPFYLSTSVWVTRDHESLAFTDKVKRQKMIWKIYIIRDFGKYYLVVFFHCKSVNTRATQFFGGSTSHLFLESLGYVCVALKRIWLRVVVFRVGLSVL